MRQTKKKGDYKNVKVTRISYRVGLVENGNALICVYIGISTTHTTSNRYKKRFDFVIKFLFFS